MAPHLTADELDYIQKLHEQGKAPIEVHAALAACRKKKKQQAPHVTKVRKALKGQTYRRAAVETRGRKKALSRHMVLKMDAARKKLLKRKQGQSEVRWADVLWNEVEKRALESAPKQPETVEAYKTRLRSIALKLPKRIVITAVEAIPKRAKAIVAANGGCIDRD